MKALRLVLAAVAACWLISPASAQTDDVAARERVARAYVEMALEGGLADMASPGADQILGQIKMSQPELWAQKSETLTAIVREELTSLVSQALRDSAPEMARSFSLAELTALRDFYATPEGRSVMKKMPQFFGRIMPRLMQDPARIQPLLSKLSQEGVKLGR